MEELRRNAEAAEAALRAERARNGQDHADSGELERLPSRAAIGDRGYRHVAPGVLVTGRRDTNPPWGFAAGWSEPGESPIDTIVREVKEEADLRVNVGERTRTSCRAPSARPPSCSPRWSRGGKHNERAGKHQSGITGRSRLAVCRSHLR
jgi:8-oxo-dGTP pyrophosphatase MutT (NUDIX family)